MTDGGSRCAEESQPRGAGAGGHRTPGPTQRARLPSGRALEDCSCGLYDLLAPKWNFFSFYVKKFKEGRKERNKKTLLFSTQHLLSFLLLS